MVAGEREMVFLPSDGARLSPKAAEPTIIVAFATVFDAEIARVAVSPYYYTAV